MTTHDPATFPTLLAAAEYATADKEWARAARLWRTVTEANPVNGAYWVNLAEACRESGDDRGAITADGEAFRLGVVWDQPSVAYRVATAHARLGELDAALSWLERAFERGFHDIAAARTDDDLASLRDRSRFRELTGMIDSSSLSRDVGWQFDVRFAAQEIRRRAFRPFGAVSEAAFASRVDAIVHAVPRLTDHQVIVELLKLVRLLNDGHARVRPSKERADLQVAAPIGCFLFEDGLFITSAAQEHRELLGAEIQAINGHAIPDVLATFEPVVVRDNENGQWFKAGVVSHLREGSLLHALGLIDDPGVIPLTVLGFEGNLREVALPTSSDSPAWQINNEEPRPDGWVFLHDELGFPVPHYLRHADLPFWFTHLPAEDTVYFQFNQVRDTPSEKMGAVGERLAQLVEQSGATKFVLDMRWNGGGNTLDEWALLHRLIASPQINRRGGFFVITGRNTFSAAQNGVNFLSVHSEAIFVGEPTGSSPSFIGETNYFELPFSKTVMNISDLHWVGTWPGDDRIWLPPTLYTPPTFAAYRENRDLALEAILAWTDHLPGR